MDHDLLEIFTDTTNALQLTEALLSRNDLLPEIRKDALHALKRLGDTLVTIHSIQITRDNQ